MPQAWRFEAKPEDPGTKEKMGTGKTKAAPVGARTMEVLERWRSPVELKDQRMPI